MDARTFGKSKLPSGHVTAGPSRAPHRSYDYGQGAGSKVAPITDGSFSGATIAIDAEKSTLDVELSEAEFERRRRAWKAPPNPYQSGALRKYADQVGPARKGAGTHAGGAKEIVCYADI
jgi:dihydroxy-acid dehydratase